MAPLIVQELRRENAELRQEVARLRRQEALLAAVARKRVEHLEAGLRSVSDRGYAHKTRAVWDALDTATGARSQPLIVAITTAGVDAKRVRRIIAAPVVIPSRAEVEAFEEGGR